MPAATLTPKLLEGLEEWIELVANGKGHYHAGLAMGWTPRQVRELLADPAIQQAIEYAKTMVLEDIEEVSLGLAKAGNVPMIQMWLYCHGAERGWRPPTQRVAVQHQGTVQVERVQAVAQAARELMKAHGPEALAYGSALDDGVVDADVVEP